jgi:hypothetical protein
LGRKRPIILSSYHLASKRLLAAIVPEIDEGNGLRGGERERGGRREEGRREGGKIRAREAREDTSEGEHQEDTRGG